ALRLYDFDSSGNVNVSTNFTGTDFMRFDFSFSSDQFTGTTGNSFLRIGFGRSGMNVASSSDGNVMGRVVLSRTGGSTSTFAVRDNTSDTTVSSNFTLQASHQVSIFANTNDSAAGGYTFSGAQTVASNTYDVFLDGVLVADDFAFRSGSTSGENDITDIGFATGGSQTTPDWLFDDITVSAVPEPSTYAMIIIAGGLLYGFRRSKK
ncbi:MAG: PEP-CTERM sorting domain-containing protein, partial [Verrucomicrobiota bacterium]